MEAFLVIFLQMRKKTAQKVLKDIERKFWCK